ncbi:type II toxin-antitoxin system death-on-curing family toxin [Maritimibacter sp. UBA3975]|uniref:type II toxin-antitoxin system death-on-curing family toxin n=1 Tax=Maritimibacter sp. UBA3975 TaxID=1946833 RepID=UPI000C0B6D83|nr:type II toxin-antitoxin system death-on-curing family toxin [Maritimibacter sp. UBA3975]MAM63060.1 type II toxin-antitoxin system death-on-curing family toxin [Maritimibacter sp.]|tara:strand:- start:11277 stop:11654 length:378 start_codon:yes stop_codon:yes gene_type:complete
MSFRLLTPETVDAIHDTVLNPGELSGRAGDKSLDGALGRVDNRLVYGMIEDAFALAAAYATVIATGHCFNDGNKRTAHQAMDVCLTLNGIELDWHTEETGDLIIQVAQGRVHEDALADWLRAKAR